MLAWVLNLEFGASETEEQQVRRYHGMVVNVGRMKRM